MLEAIQSGRTALCSRQSAIPEVAGSILYYEDAREEVKRISEAV